jgi:hypothetical protein
VSSARGHENGVARENGKSAGKNGASARNGGAGKNGHHTNGKAHAAHGKASNGKASNGKAEHGTNGKPSGEAQLLTALTALVDGDFTVRIPARVALSPEIARVFNTLAGRLDTMSDRFARLSRIVGRDGDMRARFDLEDCRGGWASMGESFNALTHDLARPSTEVARVLAAVAAGDLSQKMPLEIDGKPLRGEFLRIGTTVNTMVDELNGLAKEVTRVAREVGTEGKLGGQAHVPGVAGI